MFLEAVRESPVALVSRRDRERLPLRHLAPSLAALPFLPESGRVLDMGSGGGFPAIPLAIARPDLEFVLVDSTRKKTDFLSDCIHLLELQNARPLWERLETLAVSASLAGAFEAVTARAVAKLPELLPVVQAFLAPVGKALLWKSQTWRREGNPPRFSFVLEREIKLIDGSMLLVLSLEENR